MNAGDLVQARDGRTYEVVGAPYTIAQQGIVAVPLRDPLTGNALSLGVDQLEVVDNAGAHQLSLFGTSHPGQESLCLDPVGGGIK